MGSKWMRAIDSAQREVIIERPRSPSHPELAAITFDIQGLRLDAGGRQERFFYTDMADMGVRLMDQRPLSIWQRLLRHPSRIGRLRQQGRWLSVRFWRQPELELRFDLEDEAEADLWRECEIMTLSAGFHFVLDPEGDPAD